MILLYLTLIIDGSCALMHSLSIYNLYIYICTLYTLIYTNENANTIEQETSIIKIHNIFYTPPTK